MTDCDSNDILLKCTLYRLASENADRRWEQMSVVIRACVCAEPLRPLLSSLSFVVNNNWL